jgi:hypothetical protein
MKQLTVTITMPAHKIYVIPFVDATILLLTATTAMLVPMTLVTTVLVVKTPPLIVTITTNVQLTLVTLSPDVNILGMLIVMIKMLALMTNATPRRDANIPT